MEPRVIAEFITGFSMPSPPMYRPFHGHPHLEVIHNLAGRGVSRTADGQELAFGPGDVCIYPAVLRHDRRYASRGAALVLRLQVGGPVPAVLRRAHLIRAPLPGWVRAGIADLAGPQLAAGAYAGQARDHRCSAILCALLADSGCASQPDPEAALVGRAAQLIAERFADLGRLEAVSAELGVGHDRLRRAFRRHRSQSMIAWLTTVRMHRVQDLLANSMLDHEEIARQCGYANARYLNRVFRKAAGMTPGAWRRMAGQGRARPITVNPAS